MNKSLTRLTIVFAVITLFSASAAAQSRSSVSAAEVNGTFRMNFSGKYKEFSNDIKILALGGGKLQVAMELLYPYTSPSGEFTANTGELGGTASISGDTAVLKPEDTDCVITIKFVKAGTVKVTQTGQCGFGHNVTANGQYRKVSSKKPTFESVN